MPIECIDQTVSEQITLEPWLAVRQVAEANRITPVSVMYWLDTGVITPDGDRVRLKGFRVGRRRYTTQRDVDEFMAACQG